MSILPGFFKSGFYARRVRAILAELNVVTLEDVDGGDEFFTVTTTTKVLVLTRADLSNVEYEVFGRLAATSASADWTIEILSPTGDVLKVTKVEFNASFGQTWSVPWYVRGREKTVASSMGAAGYRVRCTENSGAGTMHVHAARLYGVR